MDLGIMDDFPSDRWDSSLIKDDFPATDLDNSLNEAIPTDVEARTRDPREIQLTPNPPDPLTWQQYPYLLFCVRASRARPSCELVLMAVVCGCLIISQHVNSSYNAVPKSKSIEY